MHHYSPNLGFFEHIHQFRLFCIILYSNSARILILSIYQYFERKRNSNSTANIPGYASSFVVGGCEGVTDGITVGGIDGSDVGDAVIGDAVIGDIVIGLAVVGALDGSEVGITVVGNAVVGKAVVGVAVVGEAVVGSEVVGVAVMICCIYNIYVGDG